MVNFNTPTKELDGATIADAVELIDKLETLREEHKGLKELAAKKHEEIEAAQAKIISILEENNLTSFEGTNVKVGLASRTSVKFPQAMEDKRALFTHIGEQYGQDVLDGMLSIHSTKFNAFYNSEFENAPAGEQFDMPGVGEPKTSIQLRVRKK